MSCCQGDLVWQYNGFHCPFCLSLQFITRAHACKHFIRKFVRKWPRYLLWQFNNAFVSQYTRKKDGFLVEKAFWFTSCIICVQITSGKNCIFFALSCNVEEKKVIWRERDGERETAYVISCSFYINYKSLNLQIVCITLWLLLLALQCNL